MLTGHHDDFVAEWCRSRNLRYNRLQIVVDHCIDNALDFVFSLGENLCRLPDQRWQLVQDGDEGVMLIVYSVEREFCGQPEVVDAVMIGTIPF